MQKLIYPSPIEIGIWDPSPSFLKLIHITRGTMVPNHDKPYLEYANLLVLREGISLANQSYHFTSSLLKPLPVFNYERHIGSRFDRDCNVERSTSYKDYNKV